MRVSGRKIAIATMAVIGLLAGRLVAYADDPALTKLLSGPPQHKGLVLPKETYVKFKVRRLKNAKVLWRNVDGLAKKGVNVPDFRDREALRAFDEQVLSHLGWVVFKEGMNEADFLDEWKEVETDRYGGGGLGMNNGTGRGLSQGQVQVKGSGQTPLVGNPDGSSHSHGGENFREGQADIVMGEMFNRELPHGANRVLFAIDTGLYLPGSEGRRILIVREDPLRPAHFVKVYFGQGPGAAGDNARLQAAGHYLIKALPPVKGEKVKSQHEVLRMRMGAYVDRAAEQYAAAMAKRLFHGATSPSNFMIDGRFIDFSTSSALLGYGPVKVLDHVDQFGKMDEIIHDLVSELVRAANNYGRVERAGVYPQRQGRGKKGRQLSDTQGVSLYAAEFEQQFMKTFDATIKKQFLLLAGFSEDVTARLGESQEAQSLGARLYELAFEPATWMEGKPYDLKGGVPGMSTSKYDTEAIYCALARRSVDAQAMSRLVELIPDETVRKRLVDAHEAFFQAAFNLETEASVPEFVNGMTSRIAERNKPLYEFFRNKVIGDANARMTSYLRYGNAMRFQRSLDQAISSDGRRAPAFKLPERCELALMQFKKGWWADWAAKAKAWAVEAQGWVKPVRP